MTISPPTIKPSVDTGAAKDRAALRRVLRQSFIAAIAFVFTAAVWEFVCDDLRVRPEIPEPFKTKIDLCFNGGPYDTAFIGSSRYFHGIDPATFDAETARLGVPTHSYNLGFDAMNFVELKFITEHVLNDPRSHLKYLFIEPSMRARLAPGLEHSQRAIVLHDATESKKIFELVLNGNHDLQRKLFWIYEHACVSATRLTNVGALTNRYIHPQEPPIAPIDAAGKAGNGFIGLNPNVPLGPATTADSIKQMVADQNDLEKSGTSRELNAFEIAQLTELQSEAAAHGVKLILLAPPTASADIYGEFTAVVHAAKSGQLHMPVYSFADPITYFDLYDPKGFVDPDHISSTIAERWTVHAADAFAILIHGPISALEDSENIAGTELAVLDSRGRKPRSSRAAPGLPPPAIKEFSCNFLPNAEDNR